MEEADIKFSPQQRKRKGIFLSCETCNREFYVNPARLRQVSKQGNTIRYCSMACYTKTGENNPFWGKRHSKDSIGKMTAHPNRKMFRSGEDNPNFVRFGDSFVGSNIAWWKENKGKITKACEVCAYSFTPILQVHHKDRDRKNNNRENLAFLCPNCHQKEHYESKDGPYRNLTPRVVA